MQIPSTAACSPTKGSTRTGERVRGGATQFSDHRGPRWSLLRQVSSAAGCGGAGGAKAIAGGSLCAARRKKEQERRRQLPARAEREHTERRERGRRGIWWLGFLSGGLLGGLFVHAKLKDGRRIEINDQDSLD
jgi:hypothetical protein